MMTVARFAIVKICSVIVIIAAVIIPIIVIFVFFYGIKFYLASQLTNKHFRMDGWELIVLLAFWGHLFLSPSYVFKPEL